MTYISRNKTILFVGIAQIITSNQPDVMLSSPGLGSCVGLGFYDPVVKCASLVHIVLPYNTREKYNDLPGRYVDTAIPEMLSQMEEYGSKKHNLIIKAAGGSQVLVDKDADYNFKIGQRNFDAINNVLGQYNLSLFVPMILAETKGVR